MHNFAGMWTGGVSGDVDFPHADLSSWDDLTSTHADGVLSDPIQQFSNTAGLAHEPIEQFSATADTVLDNTADDVTADVLDEERIFGVFDKALPPLPEDDMVDAGSLHGAAPRRSITALVIAWMVS